MKLNIKASAVTAITLSLLSTTAYAQVDNYYSRDKYESVRDRAQPDFDAEPVRLGAFQVRPELSVGVLATDNVFATSSNEESDVLARVAASVLGRTDWSNHELNFDAGISRDEYADYSDESTTNGRVSVGGVIDVSREVSLAGRAFYRDEAQSRTLFVGSTGLRKPIRYQTQGVELTGTYRNDRYLWRTSASVQEADFEDGISSLDNSVVDQQFRDNQALRARTRLSYALTPNLAIFAQATASQVEFDNPRNGRFRDSDGYTVAGGVNFELASLVRGDIAVGYMEEDKKDDFFSDVDGLSVDGRLEWFPTRLTTVEFLAGRRVADNGLLSSPSSLQTRLGARVDHELKRNIILTARAELLNDDYQEVTREDDVIEIEGIATYKMNKRVHLDAFVRRNERDVSGTSRFYDPGYVVNVVGLAVRLHP